MAKTRKEKRSENPGKPPESRYAKKRAAKTEHSDRIVHSSRKGGVVMESEKRPTEARHG